MNFDYSYKAFLITCLLVGNLILLLISVKLQKRVGPEEAETTPVEYIEMLPEELEEMAMAEQEEMEIKTNTAYNEAEKFISEIEEGRNAEFNETEPPIEDVNFNAASNDIDFSKAQQALEEVKDKLEEAAALKEKRSTKGVNRKTTITYNLKDRNALELPNPVYTCDKGGKITISIVVDALGKITKATFNPTLSTTTNGCLIDAALEYTQQSRFTTKHDREKQLGTITYLFPGQE